MLEFERKCMRWYRSRSQEVGEKFAAIAAELVANIGGPGAGRLTPGLTTGIETGELDGGGGGGGEGGDPGRPEASTASNWYIACWSRTSWTFRKPC